MKFAPADSLLFLELRSHPKGLSQCVPLWETKATQLQTAPAALCAQIAASVIDGDRSARNCRAPGSRGVTSTSLSSSDSEELIMEANLKFMRLNYQNGVNQSVVNQLSRDTVVAEVNMHTLQEPYISERLFLGTPEGYSKMSSAR